jgi:anti-sigma regulatory factor (Ser/Thr protein kinase)
MSTQTRPARAAGPVAGTSVHDVTLPGALASPRQARAFARAALAAHAQAPAGDVSVIVSELATNAVVHSRSGRPGGEFVLRLVIAPGRWVLVEVQDEGPAPARPRRDDSAPAALRESGRGLDIVRDLSLDSGRDDSGLSWARVGWAA